MTNTLEDYRQYDLISLTHRDHTLPGKWVAVIYRAPEEGYGGYARDTIQIMKSARLNGSEVFDALDGDPSDPEGRNEVIINVAMSALRKSNRLKKGLSDKAIPINTIGTIIYILNTDGLS